MSKFRSLTKSSTPKFPRFFAREEGAETIEFVLWMPVFVAILLVIVDTSVLYLTQHDMTYIARDTARRMSTGEFDADQAKTHAEGALLNPSDEYTVATSVSGDEVTISITTSVADAGMVGVFAPFATNVTSSVTMRREP